MKLLQHIIAFIMVLSMVMACSAPQEEQSEGLSKTFVADIKIEGMVCEMGCAKTIEDKLNETDGILSATVDYTEERCELQYDASRISDEQIIALIESVNGKDHYKVNTFSSKEIEVNVSGQSPEAEADDSESILEGLPEIKFPNIFSIISRL